MSDDILYVAFPGGEVPLEFQDALDWDRDDIKVVSIEERR
jgi:hypothetical protein